MIGFCLIDTVTCWTITNRNGGTIRTLREMARDIHLIQLSAGVAQFCNGLFMLSYTQFEPTANSNYDVFSL